MGDASIRGRITRDLIAIFSANHQLGRKIKSGEMRKKLEGKEWEWKCPSGYTNTLIETKNFNMEFLEPAPPKKEAPCVILQLHGGGYVGAMTNAHRSFAVLYSEAGGMVGDRMPVLTIDYRVAPENPYPAALEDAAFAFDWLLSKGYSEGSIILAGDSAGGGLAFCLCHYLRNHDRLLPKAVIAMSPWTDLTASGPSYDDNYEKDPLFGKSRDTLIYNRDYIGNNNPRNPYISPLFGDFEDFPPVLIQVGSIEMLLSDSVSVAEKIKKEKGKVRLSVYEGMFHVFQYANYLLPESKEAWIEIRRFLHLLRRS